MLSRFITSPRARMVALAVGVGAVGSLAAAPASFGATKPPIFGANCHADGKINGAGATFQTNAQKNAFIYGYQQDVCGPQPSVTGLNSAYGGTDPSIYSFTDALGTHNVNGMVAYNYAIGSTAATNGSGAGLNRMSCRTDFYAGSDLPYNAAQMTSLKAAPGTLPGGAAACATALNTGAVPPPFGPAANAASPFWPGTGSTASTPINFPVAGGAVAFAVNLNGMCTAGTPTGLNLTADEFEKIWEGTINQWNDASLVATNPILSTDNCSGNIQRVVRLDNSGTTAITMFTLDGIKAPFRSNLCGTDAATNWAAIGTSSNNSGKWPQANGGSPDCVDSASHPAPNPITATSNGSGPLISLLDTTNGGIGYAELGLWGTLPAGVSFVNIQTHDSWSFSGAGNTNPGNDANNNPPFVAPGTPGSASNCKLPATPPAGADATHAVGLGSPNWQNDSTGTTIAKSDIAFIGFGYPACGLTFGLVQSKIDQGLLNEVAASASPPATAGCTITNPAATTTSGAQTLPETTVTVASTAGYPPSGTLNVGGQTVTYTGTTATTFTGAAGGSGAIPDSSAVSLISTQAAATSTTPGITGACLTAAGATSPLVGASNDQMRTLYSYETYLLSPLGQSYLASQTYDPLPAAWLTVEQQGFQANF
jgi:ABC-type phosphate transport system substrate-binding protein